LGTKDEASFHILNRPVQFYLRDRFSTYRTGLVTKMYWFMPRVTILCHSKEELGLYIYIYDI
jgi:hypothetical protein